MWSMGFEVFLACFTLISSLVECSLKSAEAIKLKFVALCQNKEYVAISMQNCPRNIVSLPLVLLHFRGSYFVLVNGCNASRLTVP